MLLSQGSAVRLPYHQPEKKDLSVFLARTELKQKKFVGTSRLSWKQFIPPASTLVSSDNILLLADATASSDKLSSTLPAAKSNTTVEQGVSELDELPDLLSFCSSKSKTVLADVFEATDAQAKPALGISPQKLLLISPVKNTPATLEPATLPQNVVARRELEQVDTSLTPDVRKKLILDPMEESSVTPLQSADTEPAAASKLPGSFIFTDLL